MSEGDLMSCGKGLKDKICVLSTDMDTRARKVGAFYDRQLDKYVADTSAIRRAYIKKSSRYVLPLNIKLMNGEFVPTSDKARYTIRYKRVKKNADYIIQAHSKTIKKTFTYSSEDELRDKILDKLHNLNEDYDPDLQYNAPDDASSEWWIESDLENAITYHNNRGFASDIDPYATGWLAESEDEEEDFGEAPMNLAMLFNAKGLKYNGLSIYNNDYNITKNKCAWDYLNKYMGFSYRTLGDIKGDYEDAWSLEQLIEVAKYYNRYFCVYDLQGDKLRDYKSKGAYDERSFEFNPENPNHKKAMIFVSANGHIHPYNSKFQNALLKGKGGATFKDDDYNNAGKVIESKSYTSIWDIRALPSNTRKDIRKKAEVELEEYITDHEDTMEYKEGVFTHNDIGKHKYAYVEDDDLTAVLRGLVERTGEVPLIMSKNGCITELKRLRKNEETDKYELVWVVKSCPNMGIVIPMLKKLEITFVGQDITAVGKLIYQKVLGHKYIDLLSNTLGTIFTPECPFNYSTDTSCEEEDKSGYGSTFYENQQKERLDLVVASIYNSSPKVMADKLAEKKAYNKKVRALINNGVATKLEEVDTEPPSDGEAEEVEPDLPNLNHCDFLNLPLVLPLPSRVELTDADYDEYLKCNTLPELHNQKWLDELDEELRDEILEEHKERVEEYMENVKETEEKKQAVDLSHIGEWICLDIVKCYTHQLENPYNPFMTFEVFDNAVKCSKETFKEENGWYYLDNIDEDSTYFPFIGYRNGWFCLKVVQDAIAHKEKFTITQKLLPHAKNVIKHKHLSEFVKWCYDNLGDSFKDSDWEDKSAPKFIINSFIGQLGRYYRENTYAKSYLVSSTNDERYYSLKGLDTYIVRGGESPLYLMVEKEDTEYHRDGLSIHSQILQEAKVRLMEVYDLIKFSETKETRVENAGCMSYIEWKFIKANKEGSVIKMLNEANKKKLYQKYLNKNTKVVVSECELAVPLRFKTDSILIADYGSGRLAEAISKIPLSSERGGIRVEKQGNGKVLCDTLIDMLMRRFSVNMKDKNLDDSHTKKLIHHNRTDYKMLIDRGEGFRLDGMAGTGKSSLTCGGHGEEGIIPYLEKTKKKWVLTATTNKAKANKLFIENKIEARTIHSFLKIGMGLKEKSKGEKFPMCSGLDYLLIDECSMLNKSIMLHLRTIKILYPQISIILIGDYQQLPPVEKHSTKEFTLYEMEKTNLMKWLVDFNTIKLTENMRSSAEGVKMFSLYNGLLKGYYNMTKEQKETLKDMKVKDKKWRPKHIKGVNLCWRRATRDCINCLVVNKMIPLEQKGTNRLVCETYINADNKTILQKKLYDIWVWDGTEKIVKCKLTADASGENYYNNQDFYVSGIEGDTIKLTDEITDEEVEIDREQLYKHFDYGYAITIHRAQGSTIDKEYSINDWDDMCGKEENALKYVAVSRTDSSSNVKIVPSINQYTPMRMKGKDRVFDREAMLKAIAEGKWFPSQK